MKYATVTEARSKLPDLIATTEPVALTRRGKPVAVLIDVQQYRDLLLSNHMVRDPERLAQVYAEHQQLQQGDAGSLGAQSKRRRRMHGIEGQYGPVGAPGRSMESHLSEKLDRVRDAVEEFEVELGRVEGRAPKVAAATGEG